MSDIQIIFSSQEFWALIFLLVGFSLGELSRIIRTWRRKSRLKKALRDELESNLLRVPDARDVISKMMDALRMGTYLPGQVVPAFRAVFDAHYPEIVDRFSQRERILIHYVYASLKIADGYLAGFAQQFKSDIAEGLHPDPFASHITLLGDVDNAYRVSAELITSYLNGRPVDVLNENHP